MLSDAIFPTHYTVAFGPWQENDSILAKVDPGAITVALIQLLH